MVTRLIQFYLKYFVIQADGQFCFEALSPGQISSEEMGELILFRARQFEQKSPHLLTEFQAELESNLALDQRSHHILARRKDGSLIGALRMTPFPFEISAILDEANQLSDTLKLNLEISRLVTDSRVKNVGKKLLILAGLHAVETTSSLGFVGVCRVDKTSYFESFGMRKVGLPVKIKGRPFDYHLIAGDFSLMRLLSFWNYVTRLSQNPFKLRRVHERVS